MSSKFSFFATAWFACLLAMPAAAQQGERAEDYCARTTEDNAAYGNCVAVELEKDATAMQGQGVMCAEETCFVVVRCQGEVCSDQGFSIKTESVEAGRRFDITDPEGRVSSYLRCGTCNYMDQWEDGQPLGDAYLKWVDAVQSYILEFPKP